MVLQSIDLSTSAIPDSRPIDQARVDELLERYNLNWEVEKQPLYLPGQDGEQGAVTPFFGVVRTDTNTCFTTVSEKYVPFQNNISAELALMVADATGSEIEVSQSLYDGGVTYFTVTGRQIEISNAKRGDVVGEKFIIVNSHNGTKGFGVGLSHIILSCTNGMTRLDRKGYTSIRHTGDMLLKLQDAIKGIKKAMALSDGMMLQYEQLMGQQIEEKHVKKVIELATGVDLTIPADKIGTQTMKRVTVVRDHIAQEMSYKGNNAWGLFNGITKYTTAAMEKDGQRIDAKVKSKMYGHNAKTDLTVWQYLNSLN